MDTESICNEVRKEMEGVREMSIPLDGFPQKFQKLLLDLSTYDGFNMEITIMCLLSALSAAVGNSLWLHIKGDWNTNPSLFVMIVGRAGLGKSHPMKFAYGPVSEQDRIRFDKYKEEREAYNQASKEKGECSRPKPVLVKTILSDFTVEALMQRHDANPHGVALVIDELPSMLKRIEHTNSDTYEKLLSAWSMQQLISDRKCEEIPIRIDKPCVNLIGGIQTNIVALCIKPELFDNGFMDRFLCVCPKNKLQELWNPDADDSHCKQGVDREQRVWSDMLQPAFELTSINEKNQFPVRVLEFDYEAKRHFYDWVNAIIKKNNDIEDDSLIETRDSKLNSQAARLALLIQILRWLCGESHIDYVDLISVKTAINLLTYLEEGYAELLETIRVDQKQPGKRENKYAFVDKLPPEFTLKEAKAIVDKSTRTVHYYLDELCNQTDPILRHKAHNCYEKVQK